MRRASSPSITSLFEIPGRFLRSVQLERDFDDPRALDDYIVTPAMAAAFQRLATGVGSGSGHRAWRITGDFGVGKSAFAVVLAHLLADPGSSRTAALAERLGWQPEQDQKSLWPLLVTGSRESMPIAIARGICDGLERRRPTRATAAWTSLIKRAHAIQADPDPEALMGLLERVRELAAREGEGVLLIIDELGKLLEFAAGDPAREDVYLLQRLGQLASRSAEQPLHVVGLLHQGFQAYAERLPSVTRHEWDKVAGRFEEIVFDQPMAHTAALVAGALGVKTGKLAAEIQQTARATAAATASMGWMNGATSAALTLETAQLYPIHPTLLPPLVRFFSRFGQNERSLFGFLLSSEPLALQAFSQQVAGPTIWYGLPEFYDYVRAVFGHRLSGNSYQSHWLRIAATVDTAQDLSPDAMRVLKAAALLSVLDYPELLATDTALRACLSPTPARDVDLSISTLIDRGLLFRRGRAGGYRLWPATSVNLYAALDDARRALGEIETAGDHIAAFLQQSAILARRHYVDRGTMRFFEVRYASQANLEEIAARPTQADGVVVIALVDTAEEQGAAIQAAEQNALAQRMNLVVGVTRPLSGLVGEIRDLLSWQWIASHTPELAHDPYAAAEVKRQLATLGGLLDEKVGVAAALRSRGPSQVEWRRLGERFETPKGLSSVLSDVCDELFHLAPRVRNELLNRKVLSSAAAAARMRLIEGLFAASDKPLFGIDPQKAPPEKSMFLSVVERGRLQRIEADNRSLTLPEPDQDALHLRPALDEIGRMLDAGQDERVSVLDIFNRLSERPFGVRAGVAPLLLAVIMKLRGHELAIYESGTFRSAFIGQDFVRLVKAPDTFELQYVRIEGIKAEVFARLAEAFAAPAGDRDPEILDVVQPLARFAAKLPDYTRKAGSLQPRTLRVRQALLTATDPAKLLFRDLPAACDVEAFTGASAEPERAALFVSRLETAVEELRGDYPRLLSRIIDTIAATIGQAEQGFDRLAIARRASRVANTATLPKLRTYALRLRDANISDDAWAEAIASFILSKPPARWGSIDEQRALEELAALSQLFHRVETAAFEGGEFAGEKAAVLIKLTRASGADRAQVVQANQLSKSAEKTVATISATLKDRPREERLQILTHLLWEDLPGESGDAEGQDVAQGASVA